jgi:AmpE protein
VTTIVVLIGIALQRFFHWHSFAYREKAIRIYYRWIESKMAPHLQGQGWIALAILIVPVLLVVSLLLAFIYHLTGFAGYFVVNAVLFWFCVDAPDLRKYPLSNKDFSDWFAITYRGLFGPLFWYVLLGPVFFVFYVIVGGICRYLENSESAERSTPDLLAYALRVRAILDWIPVRVLGITYALVGNFRVVFGLIKHNLFVNPFVEMNQAQQLARWAMAALQFESTETSSFSEEVISLIDRALLIWIVVLALLTISFWLG